MRVLLLALSAERFDQLLAAYPGVAEIIDDAFAANESEYETAVTILTSVLADAIENGMSPERRMIVADQLEEWTSSAAPNKEGVPLTDEWARAFALLSRQSSVWVGMERIKPYSQEILLGEIVGSLRGIDAPARTTNRLFSALASALLPDSTKLRG